MIAKFLTELSVTPYAGDKWFLNTDLIYQTLHFGKPRIYVVPAIQFPTDLASIPWIVRPIVRKSADTHAAGALHDWLTWRNNSFKEKGKDGITRSDADKIFREALLVNGVPAWKATAMYNAVRAFSFMVKR